MQTGGFFMSGVAAKTVPSEHPVSQRDGLFPAFLTGSHPEMGCFRQFYGADTRNSTDVDIFVRK